MVESNDHSQSIASVLTFIMVHAVTFNYICNVLLLLQLSSELNETAEKLSATSEEIIILRGELASEGDISRTEIDGLQEQCQRLLRQNSSLLKSMATMENDLERGDHTSKMTLLSSILNSNCYLHLQYLIVLVQHCIMWLLRATSALQT